MLSSSALAFTLGIHAGSTVGEGSSIFVDSTDGDDLWDGVSEFTPKKTLASALSVLQSGQWLRLKRGSHFRESLFTALDNIKVIDYGDENSPRPVVDGSVPTANCGRSSGDTAG